MNRTSAQLRPALSLEMYRLHRFFQICGTFSLSDRFPKSQLANSLRCSNAGLAIQPARGDFQQINGNGSERCAWGNISYKFSVFQCHISLNGWARWFKVGRSGWDVAE